MPANLQKAREVFLHAVGKLPPEQWDGYVSEACGGDVELEQQVSQLLQVHREAGSFLDRPAAALGAIGAFAPAPVEETADLNPSEYAGTTIGPYKLLQQIGEGGMGIVFMAEQTEPIKRKVALKVIKPGMASSQIIARFESERQALALMDHVNIARVYDAGASNRDRPYFVMELVHGVPITKYCDDNHLTLRERLELFVPVCQAIQHAHQKGIIHRDIKPSNVMVTLYDGKPVPKVIDFGVAKATEQALTERTLFTQYGAVVGTLEYMSPEQAEMSALGVDTRSDIYSLGVLLYELLTGSTPLERPRLRKVAYGDVLRLIREEEAPKPSMRLSSSDTLPAIAAARKTEPAKLTRLLRGELDWIVLKALEKDRNRRYETASGFAADVKHYLADEPVEACPPTGWYRFRKFARRNRKALVVAGSIMGMLILAAVGLLISNGLIRHEIKLTEAARDAEAKQDHRAEENLRQTETALEAEAKQRNRAETSMRQTEAALEAEAKQRRRAETNLRLALKSLDVMYTELAQEQLAHRPDLKPLQREFLEKALQFYERFVQENGGEPTVRLETGKACRRMANIQQEFGFLQKAEAAYRRSVGILQELVEDRQSPHECAAALAGSQNDLGVLMTDIGQFEEAELAIRRAIVLAEKLVAEHVELPGYKEDLARWLGSRARLLRHTGRFQEALNIGQHSIDLLTELAKSFPQNPRYQHSLAVALLNHNVTRSNIGRQNHQAERPRAEDVDRQAQTILEKLVLKYPNRPQYRQDLALAENNLGADLRTAGLPVEAERRYRAALVLYRKLADDFPQIPDYEFELARGYGSLGLLLEATEQHLEAEQFFRQALLAYEKLTAAVPDRHDYQNGLTDGYLRLGMLLESESRFADAEKLYRQALGLHPSNTDFKNVLAWLLANCADPALRRPAEAVELAQSVVQEESKSAIAWTTLGAWHYRAGNHARAVEALETAVKLRPPSDSLRWIFLAMAEKQLGHDAQAQKWYDLAATWMEKHGDRVAKDPRARKTFPPLHAEAENVMGGVNRKN